MEAFNNILNDCKDKPGTNYMDMKVQHLTMKEQCETFNKNLNDWKDNLVQIDDVLVIGIKI